MLFQLFQESLKNLLPTINLLVTLLLTMVKTGSTPYFEALQWRACGDRK